MEIEIPRITSINFRYHFQHDFLEEYLRDLRISTLQVRLSHEILPDVCLVYACQITCSINYLNNESYVKQNHVNIMEKMAHILSSNKSDDVKRETVSSLVSIFEIVTAESETYLENFYSFLRSGMSYGSSGTYYILALSKIVKYKRLNENDLIEDIKAELEKTDSSSKTVDLVDLLSVISEVKPGSFVNHFFDIVDILVGCLIDDTYKVSSLLSFTITKTFIKWSSYWLMDVNFSTSLLQSFTEDFEDLTQDILKANSPQTAAKFVKNIINLLQIFNTILSSIHGKGSNNALVVSSLDVWTEKIFACLEATIPKFFSETLLVCGQRTFLILIKDEGGGTFKAKYEKQIYKLIQVFTLPNFESLTFRGKEFSLKFIAKVFKHSNSSQQATIAKSVLSTESIVNIVFSVDQKLKLTFIHFYSILLNSKSVLVMQDVYSYLVNLLKSSLKDSDPGFSPRQANTLILYILGSFSNLISPNGSVISKWALDPPIFTVLCADNQIVDPEYIRKEPLRHQILLTALHSHCHLNDNFIRTSSINAVATSSLTSTFYEKILQILKSLLDVKNGDKRMYLGVLNWVERTFNIHAKIYTTNPTLFSCLIDSVLKFLCIHHNPKLVQKCLKPLVFLMNNGICSQEQMDLAYRISCVHINSKNDQVRELCTDLHFNIIPSLAACSKPLELEMNGLLKNQFLCHSSGQVSHVGFRHLIAGLFQKNPEEQGLPVLRGNLGGNKTEYFVKEGALYNNHLFNFWQSFEISWFSIANKLKTPLGKAQDLLTTIEKEISLQSQSPNVNLSHSLLGFFDIFERMLINACKGGSAFHCKVPSKTSLSFFTANEKTCTDWIRRVRPSLVALAFKVNAYDFVIRQCNEALSSEKVTNVEAMIVFFGIALFKKGLPYHMKGLYSWVKKNTKIDGKWILSLADLTDHKTELLTKLLQSSSSSSKFDVFIRQTLLYEASFAQYQNQIKNYYYSQSNEAPTGAQGAWETLCMSFDEQNKGSDMVVEPCLSEAHQKLVEASQILLGASATGHFHLQQLNNKLSKAKRSLSELCQLNLNSRSDVEMTTLLKLVMKELTLSSSRVNLSKSSFLNDVTKLLEDSLLSLKTLVALKDWTDIFIGINGINYPPSALEKAESLTFRIVRRSRDAANFPLALKYLGMHLRDGEEEIDVLTHGANFKFSESFMSIKEVKIFQEVATVANALDKKDLAAYLLTGSIYSIYNMNILNSHSNDNFEVSILLADLMHDLAVFKKQTLKDGEVVNGTVSISDILISGNHFINSSVCELIPYSSVNPDFMEIGFLLKNAVSLSSDVAKYWGTFGDWAFELGEMVLQNEIKSSLRESDKEALLTFNLSENVFERLCSMFSNPKLQTKLAVDMTKLEFMEDQLKDILSEEEKLPDLQKILHIWSEIQKRIYFYFELSLFSYFQQISLSTCQEKVIPATLRILHMIVKYSLELEESLEKGLSVTPCRQWIPIIPQLFSRLNHPIRLVRNKLIELLCRLSKENAQSIIYPAIVGSFTKGCQLSQILEEEEVSGEESSLQNAHIQIVNKIRSECLAYDVDEIVALVFELQRISLLWNELWSATLHQHCNDVNQRAKKLDREISKLRQNSALNELEVKRLIHEKFNITFKPLIYVLEKIEKITSSNPETLNEINFGKKYQEHIKSLMDSLRNPGEDPFTPVNLLKQLQGKLPGKLYRHHYLSMKELSSVLSKFKNVKVPMPGLMSNRKVNINSFHDILTTLVTKTKPKKLWILGSDGKRYGYLLKGLEDLHLDERIMQFLSITNYMTHSKGYKARTYAVVPLGIRSGLIQWVKKAIPVFSLYKKWQTKKANNAALQNPSDIFYSKLFPLLREKGINNLDSRKKWPDSVLREVMETLLAETPADLITSEIFLASYNSSDWWAKINSLTKSIAIMSTIGYVIGLGDRHLDNLLIDFAAGEIIHIDYNVCFEKGKNLSIPEKVPCRLTQNIVKIFGVPGTGGSFKVSCEDVLGSLRQGCDTLINLLEAFVYDPLVDWTPGVDNLLAQNVQESKHNKKDLQTEIMFSMYCVRITEIESSWTDNKVAFMDFLSKMENALDLWLEADVNSKNLNQDLSELHVCMSLLKDAESNPRHKLFYSKSLYNDFRETKNFEALVQEKVEANLVSLEKQCNLVQRTYSVMCSSQLEKWNNGLSAFSLSSPVIAGILDKYGGNQLGKLKKMEESYISSIEQIKEELAEAVDLLSNTIEILSPLYSANKKKHILFTAIDILNKLSNELSLDSCNKAKNLLTESYRIDEEEIRRLGAIRNSLNGSWIREVQTLMMSESKEIEVDFKNRSKIAENTLLNCLSDSISHLTTVGSKDDVLSNLDDALVIINVILNADQIGALTSTLVDLTAAKNAKMVLNGIHTFKCTMLFSVFFEASHIFIKDRNSLLDLQKELRGLCSENKELLALLRGDNDESLDDPSLIQRGLEVESQLKVVLDKTKNTTSALFFNLNSSLIQMEQAEYNEEKDRLLSFMERLSSLTAYLSLVISYSLAFLGETEEDIPRMTDVHDVFDPFFRNLIGQVVDLKSILPPKERSLDPEQESEEAKVVFGAFRDHMKSLHLEHSAKMRQKILKACEDQLTSFQWLHENYLDESSSQVRNDLLNLKKYMKTLPLKFNKFSRISKEYEKLQKSQESASSEDLRQELKKYFKASDKRAEAMSSSLSYVYKSVVSALNAIHLNESLRNLRSEESLEMKASLTRVLDDCFSLSKAKDKLQGVASYEIKLYAMNEPLQEIDLEWIQATSSILSERVKKIQSELTESNNKLSSFQSVFEDAQGNFRETFARHQRLMSDVSVLLQSLSDSEDYEIPRVKSYVSMYKEFSSLVSQIAEKSLVIRDSSVERIIKTIAHLKGSTSVIYDELICLSDVLKDENIGFYKVKKDLVQDNSPQDRKVEEERNAFAINVLRRVRSKLEGKEPDPLCQVSVPDQVDFFIKEATSPDNLYQMYEGWTAWI